MCACQHVISVLNQVNRAGGPFFCVQKLYPGVLLEREPCILKGHAHASYSYCSPSPQASAFQSKVQEHSGTLQV